MGEVVIFSINLVLEVIEVNYLNPATGRTGFSALSTLAPSLSGASVPLRNIHESKFRYPDAEEIRMSQRYFGSTEIFTHGDHSRSNRVVRASTVASSSKLYSMRFFAQRRM